MEFPDDLNQHFNNGSISLKDNKDHIVPAMVLPDGIQECGHENIEGFFDKYDSNNKQDHGETRCTIEVPRTPLRKVPNTTGGIGSEFSVLRSHIVPETPIRVIINDEEHDRCIFRVPETPKIDISKIPVSVRPGFSTKNFNTNGAN
jgi:hypothetical protein